MSLSKFESMLKTNEVYFFDAVEFETIIEHYLTIGKHSLAKKAVELGLAQHPTSIQLKLMQVELLIFEDDLEQASQLLSEIESVEPYNDEVFIQKAIILSKKKEHLKAIEILNECLKHVEDPEDIWSMLGMEYLYLDDYKNARKNFIKCIAVDMEDYSSLYNVVYCFDMEEMHEEAIVYLNSYVDKNPYCEVAWHQLGRQYFETGKFKEALTSFDYAVLIDDSFIGGYLEKAKTLEELNDYEEAVDLAQESFVRVYFAIERYHSNYAFSTYIYRIATNLAISEIRKRKRRKLYSLTGLYQYDGDEDMEFQPEDEKPLPEDDLISVESQDMIKKAMVALPEK